MIRFLPLLIFGVLVVGCNGVSTSGGPLKRNEALDRSQLELPLPASAYDVYFFHMDYGSQDHDLFVRFSGDIKDIRSFVKVFFEERNEYRIKMGMSPLETFVERGTGAMSKRPWAGPYGAVQRLPNWWHPETIAHGYYIGDTSNEYFWIDEIEGKVFYYRHY